MKKFIYFFIFVIILYSSSASPIRAASNQSHPNIVVIMTDDQDDMGSMAAMPKTLSLIGSQGLTFTNSFTDFPLCCPSRASLLTGQAAHNHGVLGNAPSDSGGYSVFKPTENNSLPVWLQQAGYTTGYIGKWMNGYSINAAVPPGLNFWSLSPGDAGAGGAYYNYAIKRNGGTQAYGSAASDYKTDVQAQDAENFIASQQNSAQPFFLWLAPTAPHAKPDATLIQAPPDPAPRHLGVYNNLPLPQLPNFNEADVSDKPGFIKTFPLMNSSAIAAATDSFRRRRESLLAVDDMVERVINALQVSGKLNNTYIVFTSDNGFFEGQHRRVDGKFLVYEESIRVPLLVRGPGISVGQTRSQLVNNLDVVATIEELTGITPGRSPDGKSLVPLFQNTSAPWRSSLLVQGLDRIYSAPTSGRYQAVRTSRYVYIEHNSADFGFEKEFYDLSVDPYELTSKPADPTYASIINDLQDKLKILKSCVGETCWMTSNEPTLPTSPTASPTPTTFLRGDLDHDGDVDIFDYNILVTNFGRTGTNVADIDGNGRVDIFDYNIIVTNFGKRR